MSGTATATATTTPLPNTTSPSTPTQQSQPPTQQQQPQQAKTPSKPANVSPNNVMAKITEEITRLRKDNQRLEKLYSDSDHDLSELRAKHIICIKEQDAQKTQLLESRAAAEASERERERVEKEFAEFRAKNNPDEFLRKIRDLEAQVETLQRHRVDNEGLQAQVISLNARIASLTDAKRADAETIDKITAIADDLRRNYDALATKCAGHEALTKRLAEAEAAASERDRLAGRVAELEAQRAAAANLGVLFCSGDAATVNRIAGELSAAGKAEESIELQELAGRLDAKYDRVQEEAAADRTAKAKAEQDLALFKGELKGNVMPEVQRLRRELAQLRGKYESLFACLSKIKPEMEALSKVNEAQKTQITSLERSLYDKMSSTTSLTATSSSSSSSDDMSFASFSEMRAFNARLVAEKEAFEAAQKELAALRKEHAELVALRVEHEKTEAKLALITSEKRVAAVLDKAKQVVTQGPSQARGGQCANNNNNNAETVLKLEKEVRRLNREVFNLSKENYEYLTKSSECDGKLKKAQDECERLRGRQKELAEQAERLEKEVAEKEKVISEMNAEITSYKEGEWKLENKIKYQNEEIEKYKANETEMSAKIERLSSEVAYHVSSLSGVLDVRKDSLANYTRLKNFMQENHLREINKMREEFDAKIAAYENQIKELKEKCEAGNDFESNLLKAKAAAKELLEERSLREKYEEQISALKEENERLQSKIQSHIADETQKELQMLKESNEAYRTLLETKVAEQKGGSVGVGEDTCNLIRSLRNQCEYHELKSLSSNNKAQSYADEVRRLRNENESLKKKMDDVCTAEKMKIIISDSNRQLRKEKEAMRCDLEKERKEREVLQAKYKSLDDNFKMLVQKIKAQQTASKAASQNPVARNNQGVNVKTQQKSQNAPVSRPVPVQHPQVTQQKTQQVPRSVPVQQQTQVTQQQPQIQQQQVPHATPTQQQQVSHTIPAQQQQTQVIQQQPQIQQQQVLRTAPTQQSQSQPQNQQQQQQQPQVQQQQVSHAVPAQQTQVIQQQLQTQQQQVLHATPTQQQQTQPQPQPQVQQQQQPQIHQQQQQQIQQQQAPRTVPTQQLQSQPQSQIQQQQVLHAIPAQQTQPHPQPQVQQQQQKVIQQQPQIQQQQVLRTTPTQQSQSQPQNQQQQQVIQQQQPQIQQQQISQQIPTQHPQILQQTQQNTQNIINTVFKRSHNDTTVGNEQEHQEKRMKMNEENEQQQEEEEEQQQNEVVVTENQQGQEERHEEVQQHQEIINANMDSNDANVDGTIEYQQEQQQQQQQQQQQ